MPSARDIRRRIKSVKNIKQITKAMEMVAAARLRRAQDRANACKPYVAKIREILNAVAAHPSNQGQPVLGGHAERKICYFIVSADKGLAGAYNSNVFREARARLQETGYTKLIVSGRKARDYFRRRNFQVDQAFTGISERPHFDDATRISKYLMDGYLNDEYNEIQIVYTHFFSPMNHRPTLIQALPLVVPGLTVSAADMGKVGKASQLLDWESDDDDDDDEAEAGKYIIEPSPREVLGRLVPRHLEAAVFQALLQSAASELGARMTAMGAATSNAEEIISQLVLNYNKVRQAAITREISEIVGGVEALQ